MTYLKQTDSRLRAFTISILAGVALAACGGDAKTSKSSASANAATSSDRTIYERDDDHAIGSIEAKITLVEHASVTCSHCRTWHESVYPEFKKKYVDKGHVRFVFREFPTAPENLARAGFLIANCSGEDLFFDNISLQFKRQPQIFDAARKGTVKKEYIALAKAGGLSEAEFEACLKDEAQNERYQSIVQQGIDAGVTGTPSFFMNGEKLVTAPNGDKIFSLESFDSAFESILGASITASDKDETVADGDDQ